MLLCALFTILLPVTTTEVTSTPEPSNTETPKPMPEKTETTHVSNKIHTGKINPTTVKVMELQYSTMTTYPQAPVKQMQTTAKLKDTTVTPTRIVNTPHVNNNLPSTPLVPGNDPTTATFENMATATTAINNPTNATSTRILNTSEYNSSIRATTMKTETPKVAVPTERLSTRAVPTAKLSAITQIAPSVKMTTNLAKTTEEIHKSKIVPTVKPSMTTQIVQKTTANVAKTTEKLYPPIVTTGPSTPSNGEKETQKGVKHGKIVAGIIGGTLIAMMIGFLVILYKKHKLKKHQIATNDWAGPTPFLETGGGGSTDKNNVSLRSANRISLTSFLPHRLSKRLSLLAESAEEMQDMQEMTTGTTFAANDEKAGTKSDQTIEKSDKEANGINSESSEKMQEVPLADKTKGNDGETGIDKQNGEAVMKDGEKGQKGESENAPTQPVPKDDAPVESKDQDKAVTESAGGENV